MKFFLLLLAFLFAGAKAWAFPQMIAHGYPSCVACHVNPSGGGMLTPYGRSLSREVMSQTGIEGEENALYGVVRPPSWLQLGGDLRVLQNYMNTKTVEAAKFTVMQADLEMGVVTEKVQVVGTFGYQNPMSANSTKSPLLSRRHYVQYVPVEGNYLRAGKFDLTYGVRWPDHVMFQRRDLGWDEGSEAYRVEWTRLGESLETTVGVSAGRFDSPELQVDKSVSLRAAYTLGEKNLVGFSGYYGANDAGPRAITGPFAAVTLLKGLTLFAEIDLQKMLGEKRGLAWGAIQTGRLNYEILTGLHLYLLQEYSRMDLSVDASKRAYTLGTQWFFRPHIEIAAAIRTQEAAQGTTDSAWVMMHYYL